MRVDRLAKAIERAMGLRQEEAFRIAQRVLNYFGFESFIIDNALDQEDRKLFYQLQDAKLLRNSWETVLLPSGKSWRIFYWEINSEEVDRLLERRKAVGASVYKSLPEDMWERGSFAT